MRKLFVVLSLIMAFSFQAMAYDVFVDGEQLVFDVPPQIINSRLMLPLRSVFEAIGAEVKWDPETQTITGTKGDRTVVMAIGDHAIDCSGEVTIVDVPPTIIEGRTFVPVRIAGEALGCTVEFETDTGITRISTPEKLLSADPPFIPPVVTTTTISAADLTYTIIDPKTGMSIEVIPGNVISVTDPDPEVIEAEVTDQLLAGEDPIEVDEAPITQTKEPKDTGTNKTDKVEPKDAQPEPETRVKLPSFDDYQTKQTKADPVESPEPNKETYEVTGQLVYVTDTGDKYHRSGCRYLNKSSHAIDLGKAIAQSYTACKVCKP